MDDTAALSELALGATVAAEILKAAPVKERPACFVMRDHDGQMRVAIRLCSIRLAIKAAQSIGPHQQER